MESRVENHKETTEEEQEAYFPEGYKEVTIDRNPKALKRAEERKVEEKQWQEVDRAQGAGKFIIRLERVKEFFEESHNEKDILNESSITQCKRNRPILEHLLACSTYLRQQWNTWKPNNNLKS
jgi:hypothetical protein